VDLSPPQRFALFAVVVLVLASLGVYLFLPNSLAASGHPQGTARQHGKPPAAGRPGTEPAGSTASPGSPDGPVSSSPAPDIYQWLPFTQAGLAAAAAQVTSFAVRYGTYSYTEGTEAYLAPMRPLMSSQLADVLGRAYGAPGLAASRTAAKQSATATAMIVALRAFGPSSLTFVVLVTQKITTSKGTNRQRTDYAITLTGDGTNWQVTDLELSSAGNP
jgi:hypothetical protein